MFDTPKPLLLLNQMFSCSRISGDEMDKNKHEEPVIVRGRRRSDGTGRPQEIYEITYLVDIPRLRRVRAEMR